MRRSLRAVALLLLSDAAFAGDRPLLIPQVEGAKQGRILGRGLACGVGRERIEAVIRTNRGKMLAAVGRPFTEDRYGPALDEAIGFETSLPRPSEAACAKALAEFESLEAAR